MIITHRLTTGQITFILRVAVQILSYAGLFLVGLIVVATAPRIASVETHDVLNRVVGSATVNNSAVKWMFKRLRRRSADPSPPFGLFVALFLSVSYALFVSLSDVGFLGLYACTTIGPSHTDFPASIATDDAARTLVLSNMINGTDINSVNAYRCDSSQLVKFGDITEQVCNSWHNSTFADQSFYVGMNMTDSDVLMPLQLQPYKYKNSDKLYLNAYYRGLGVQKVAKPIIQSGLVLQPHDTGFRVIVGVPKLENLQKVTLSRTMAIEVDVGCMAVGMYTQTDSTEFLADTTEVFATNGSWRQYAGPDYLQPILSKTVDDIRQYHLPLYNTSTLDSKGFMMGINKTFDEPESVAMVRSTLFQDVGGNSGSNSYDYIFGNCSSALRASLNITVATNDTSIEETCSFLSLEGSSNFEGLLWQGRSRMACATATQVNMVSATIETDNTGAISVDLTRLPSNIHTTIADWYDVTPDGNDTRYGNWDKMERYTLSENATGPTNHFILQRSLITDGFTWGSGSGGGSISRAGTKMLNRHSNMDTKVTEVGFLLLEDGGSQLNFTARSDFAVRKVAKWAGTVGASYIATSNGYNGWAARNGEALTVLSTGGQSATCYKPQYALGFFPLLLSALVVICWSLYLLLTSSLLRARHVKERYGGLQPYADRVCPTHHPEQTLLAWNVYPQPHLEVLANGQPIQLDGMGKASDLILSDKLNAS